MFYAIWPFIYNMKMQAFENRFQSERFWKCTIVVCVNYKKCEFVIFLFIVKIILLNVKKNSCGLHDSTMKTQYQHCRFYRLNIEKIK